MVPGTIETVPMVGGWSGSSAWSLGMVGTNSEVSSTWCDGTVGTSSSFSPGRSRGTIGLVETVGGWSGRSRWSADGRHGADGRDGDRDGADEEVGPSGLGAEWLQLPTTPFEACYSND
jgi:hypothetical protein